MHFGKSHLEDKREDLRSHYGKIEKTAGVTALRIAFCLLLVVLVCGTGLVIGAVRGVIDSAPDISEANIMPLGNASFIYDADGNQVQKLTGAQETVSRFRLRRFRSICSTRSSRLRMPVFMSTTASIRAVSSVLSLSASATAFILPRAPARSHSSS